MPPRVRLTRTARFSAAHRYHRADWTEDRNREVFGENVGLHGHNYLVEATVEGEVDPETGFSVDLGRVDAALGELTGKLGWRDLSNGVEELAGAIPTTENLALMAFRVLKSRVGDARLVRVRVYESPELSVEVTGDGP